MKTLSASVSVLCASFIAALLLLQAGCEIDGGDETVRTVSVNVEGTYRNGSGIPERQSGNRVTQLTLVQSGDQLTAIDNQGARWSGTIGRAGADSATLTLRGMTSNGVEVVITGTITVSGTNATLSGLWVEPGLNSGVSASASDVAPQPTATPPANNTPDPGATSTPVPEVTSTPTTIVFPTPTPTDSLPPIPG